MNNSLLKDIASLIEYVGTAVLLYSIFDFLYSAYNDDKDLITLKMKDKNRSKEDDNDMA